MENIDEMIADAKAEEEVKQASLKDFRETLRNKLNDTFTVEAIESPKVTIDLDEYLMLKYKARDLEKIIQAILVGFRLNYSKDDLSIDKAEVLEAFKVLYRETYEDILAEKLAEEGDE